ncbi:MAG: hypothetical protein L0206_06845 [Actinobacteria bacterium]|nr:hypothetical protein [Actinomycetota bacterium]
MAPKGRPGRRGIAAVLALATAAMLVLGASSLATAGTQSDATEAATRGELTSKRAFHDGMRRLWVDHVTWTRLFIVSFVADLPDLQATTDRLLQNQVDIGDAVKPFYGEAAGDELTDLLTEHILTAADLLAAAKAGDTVAFEEARVAWYANARQIAAFLHNANPTNWPRAEMRDMMREHLDLTLAEASAQLGGDYAASVALYDEIETQILAMADMLSKGIIKQFPQKFA